MILDHENAFAIRQSITNETTSDNIVFLGGVNHTGTATGYDYLPVALAVAEVFAPAGDANTLEVSVETSPLEDFSTDVETHRATTLTAEQLARGGTLPLEVSLGPRAQSYARLRFKPTGANFTSGRLTAMVSAAVQANV